MQCLEQRVDRQVNGPQHLRGVNEGAAHQTSNTVTNELGGEDDENGSTSTWADSIVKLLDGQGLRTPSTD